MPTYEYKCTLCEIEFEKFCPISMRNKSVNEPCPNCDQIGCIRQKIGTSNIVSGTGDVVSRTDGGWNEVLSKINDGCSKKGNSISTK